MEGKTRKNCFRYLKLMSPLNAAICITIYLRNNYLTIWKDNKLMVRTSFAEKKQKKQKKKSD
jgi:hypothetical protein